MADDYRRPGSPEAPDVKWYLVCERCSVELPAGTFPASTVKLSIGVSPTGALVVWCERHRAVVAQYRNDVINRRLLELAQS